MKKTFLLSTALASFFMVTPALAETTLSAEDYAQPYEFNVNLLEKELNALEPAAGHGGYGAHGSDASQSSIGNDGSFASAIKNGKFDLSFRYRLERADVDGFADNSTASTLQTLVGYRTGEYKNASAYVQFRDVSVIGSDNFNDTLNGQTTRPVVPDPPATEIDQAYLDFNIEENTRVTVGRRKLKWGNRRFVAALGWRQNNRSFDGVVVENTSLKDTELHYAFANNVNRAFTDRSNVGNFDGDTRVHLANARYSGLPIGKLTGYGYFLDLDGFGGGLSAADLSTKTFGVNLTGKKKINDVDFGYIAEYATQSDFGDNPTNFTADYFRVEPSVTYNGFTVKAGYEVLGSDDGNIGFTTPLALLHAFNGWADVFVNTPAQGLEDAYISLGYKWKSDHKFFNGGRVQAIYHDFRPNEGGGGDFGTEFDAVVAVDFLDHYNVALKYADYNADNFAADTERMWLTIGAKF